jgi:hypothetical protein
VDGGFVADGEFVVAGGDGAVAPLQSRVAEVMILGWMAVTIVLLVSGMWLIALGRKLDRDRARAE